MEETMQQEAITQFKGQLRGDLIEPTDARYEEARKVYNAMISRKPRLIAKCADVADVIAAVRFGLQHDLRVSIRGGGHNAGGLGVCDDGLVIDLSLIKYVHVDPAARAVRVGGGCTWGDVDHATHAFGLAVPSGVISTTGVGGLTLGGGLGHLSREYGLTIDNLLAVDMVLADGRFVTASAEENQDLFWAVRGGGGNFGVVTSFVFRLHPISTVYAGPMLWPMDRADEVMRWYRDFILAAPETLGGWFAFLKVPPGPPFPTELHTQTMCGVVWTFTGPPEEAEAIFAAIRRDLVPTVDVLGSLPFPALQSMFDPLVPHGIHGAVHRVANNDTAFNYRDANFAQVIVGFSVDPADADLLKSWTVAYWDALHPYSLGGAYVNFMMDEGADRIKATYRDSYDRLVAVKNHYDPTSLFHINQNIKPTA